MVELDEEVLLLAHEIVRPEDSGDHRPVKLASARSNADTVELTSRIAFLVDKAVAIERERCAQCVIDREKQSDGLLRGAYYPDGVGKGPKFLSAGEMTARAIRIAPTGSTRG